MKILITNDDGIMSPGLLSLRDVLSSKHDVWVMAPDGDRSGFSHSITLREPVKILEQESRMYSCSGTPVDCVVYGIGGFLKETFDVILSGINIGPNLGTDILYSGTAAAARQGALKKVPSIALSLNQFLPPFDFTPISEFVLANLEYLVSQWDESCFLNMNFPQDTTENCSIKWCHTSKRLYKDEIVQFKSPRNSGYYCFLKGSLINTEEEEGSDAEAVFSGHIGVSAICLSPSIVSHIGEVPEKAGTVCR
jgi:5'-nucleotidase